MGSTMVPDAGETTPVPPGSVLRWAGSSSGRVGAVRQVWRGAGGHCAVRYRGDMDALPQLQRRILLAALTAGAARWVHVNQY